jgi:beta-mannanase
VAGVPSDLSALKQLSIEVGRRPNVVMWYVAWSTGSSFPATAASAITDWGATPEITWEPWNPANGVSQPAYTNGKVSGGSYDTYIRSWAVAIKSWGQPLRLRFAHEMNGTWYPWADGVNSNKAGSYVSAWLHVQSIFRQVGTSNVTWIWSPQAPYPGLTALSQVFPGDPAVDEAALDGYNWSTRLPGTTWTTFAGVFQSGITQLAALTTRPISIGEVGCPETGGNKAQWINDTWKTLSSWRQVRGLVWFDHNKEADWRLDSSAASLSAFSTGLPTYLAQ